ncbi:protein far1-related sequence 5 [Phtheirospermum japonicum]|uniref:Protein far1-related sequence 5 n=1 Tax=Phtheirospermum japonicum TaxID=374723 RepID=A0A830C2X8_9LAMI|nr:protein far1-related sequence 5 [Phtheirospermum japonicum]
MLDSQIFTPTIDIGLIPKVGQEFESSEAAHQFYNDYAKKLGFSTKINNSSKNSAGVVTWKAFSCSKEGKTNESYRKNSKDTVERSGERRRTDTRCMCEARNISRKQDGDGWVVTLFEDRHNHSLITPRKAHMLRSHRKVTTTKKALMQEYSEANIPTHTQIRLMQNDAGDPSAMGCLEKDIYNYGNALKAEIKGCDAQTMIHHFETEKERNDAYFYSYDIDSDETLTRCFWADSDSRNSYAVFGDAIVFDTTYNTNKYGLYLAPFVGVNNHRQTIVFGCGLISDQSTDSFVWLFKKFLEAMPYNAPPKVILTDQDAAISRAIIEKQMANTYTKTVFGVFQKEFAECARYTCHIIHKTDETMTFEVRRFDLGVSRERHRELTRNILTDQVSCSCRMFEFEGVPCRHMLCWMRVKQVMVLPEHYILHRWTKSAKNDPLYDPTIYTFTGKSLQSRRASLKQLVMEVVDAASLTEVRSTYFADLLKTAKAIISEMDTEGKPIPQRGSRMIMAQVDKIKDPVRAKNRGTGKRLKTAKERATSQRSRHCSGCGEIGHDLRTCQASTQRYVMRY